MCTGLRLYPLLLWLIAAGAALAASPRSAFTAPTRPMPYVGLGHTAPVTAMAWSPDGRTLATGSEDQTIVLWDTSTGRPRATLSGYTTAIECLAWSPDGKILAGSDSGTPAILWDAATGRRRAVLAPASSAGGFRLWASPSHLSGLLPRAQPAAAAATSPRDDDWFASGSPIRSLAWNADGRFLAGLEDPYALIWDGRTGKRRTVIGVGDHRLLRWRPDGRALAVDGGPHGDAISLWDDAGRYQGGFDWQQGYLEILAWSPDGKWIAGADDGGALLLWEGATRRRRVLVPRQQVAPSSVAWSPDGKLLASRRSDGTPGVAVWDAATGKVHVKIEDPDGVGDLLWSPDERTLAIAGSRQFDLWDPAARKRTTVLHGLFEPAAWRPDGKLLAIAGPAGSVTLYESPTGRPHAVLGGSAAPLRHLAWSPEGTAVAAGTDEPERPPSSVDGSLSFVTIWEASIGRPRSRLFPFSNGGPRGPFSGTGFFPVGTDRIYDLRWSPNGSMVATATGVYGSTWGIDGPGYPRKIWYRRAVILWDAKSARRRAVLPGAAAMLTWSPNGKTLASGSGGEVLLWDPVVTAAPRGALSTAAEAWQLAWSADGKRLATAGFTENRFAVQIWDTDTTIQRGALPLPANYFPALAWSPKEPILALAADDHRVDLYDETTGELQRTLVLRAGADWHTGDPGPRGEALLAWASDGKRLAAASTQSGPVKLWNAVTGDLVAILTRPASITSGTDVPGTHALDLKWGPGGETLASAYADHTAILWNPALRKIRAVLRGHTGPITAMAWSPDGRLLATGSEDGSLRLWDGATGRERVALYSLDGGTEWLAITREGYFAASVHGADVIQWRQGGKLWPMARFRRRFERPDLVRKALSGLGQ